MRKPLKLLTGAMLAALLGGCGLVYHPPLEQGNLSSAQAASELKPGLTKQQVLSLMGSPAIQSPFDNNEWNYVYVLDEAHGTKEQHKLSLFFDNDILAKVEGESVAADNSKMLKLAQTYEVGDKKTTYEQTPAKGDKD